MEINGVSIPRCRIEKIKNADDPLMARTLWEKIKNWFGIGQEVTVILLIKDTFFNLETTALDKIKGFCQLMNFSSDLYKERFFIEKKEDRVTFSILLNETHNDEKIEFSYNINEDGFQGIKLIADIIIALKKNGFNDLLIDAINKFLKIDVKDNENDKIKKEIIIGLIKDNIDRFKGESNFNRDYILKNKLYKESKFDCDLFPYKLKNLIENEKKEIDKSIHNNLLEKIELELFKDLSRMNLSINTIPIADLENKPQDLDEIKFKELEFEKLKNEFKNLDGNDKEIIYSLLYQKGLLEFKLFLIEQDPFSGLINVPYSGKTTINVIKEDSKNKIRIEIENKKSLQDKSTNDIENINNLINTELAYVNEQHYNLVNLVSEELVEKPFSLDKYSKVTESDDSLPELLSVGDKSTLEDHTKLIFEYDFENKTLILDNKSKYEYAILKY
ncbi:MULTISPECIES: hypothetical protein [Proteus]|uniref:hypothetical protein n=1 Tax=Proteus TaxID=583 RepID=UPI000DFE8464|nr:MULTISPECIES: hypothetical protein [Proteus]MCO8050669.1 hypothetical protein [Proteus penneri]NBM02368.1 hypothetical protein [Proteus sp. G2671]NBM50960.1 hypothetical protein [Proteus sp. G2666]NBM67890.1 hypothetical protein [Proteus sp. G2663]NBM94880.1 hypothetical protein [Proteus sp. G2662]